MVVKSIGHKKLKQHLLKDMKELKDIMRKALNKEMIL